MPSDPELRAAIADLRGSVDVVITDLAAQMSEEAARTSHLATGATTALVAIGGSVDVVITWSGDGFPSEVYAVDLIGVGLLGKATLDVAAQDRTSVTVRVTAQVALGAGAQFLAYGRC